MGMVLAYSSTTSVFTNTIFKTPLHAIRVSPASGFIMNIHFKNLTFKDIGGVAVIGVKGMQPDVRAEFSGCRFTRVKGGLVDIDIRVFKDSIVEESTGPVMDATFSNCRIENSKFLNNKLGYGHLISIQRGLIRNCEFIGNDAKDGLLRMDHSSVAEMNKFERNVYHKFNAYSFKQFTKNIVIHNKATERNVFYRSASDGEFYDNEISHNSAKNGGGVYYYLDEYPDNPNAFSGNKIHSNTAERGGGMYIEINRDSEFNKKNEIYNNLATEEGGGLYFNSIALKTMKISSFSLHQNKAKKGGAFSCSNNVISFINSVIKLNAAQVGGSCLCEEKCVAIPIGTDISDNSGPNGKCDFPNKNFQ